MKKLNEEEIRLFYENKFIINSLKIHNNKYDYSKVKYIKTKAKVCIMCPEHGEFWQTPYNHLIGKGCPKCAGKNKTTNDFIDECHKVHSNRYDYSQTEYHGSFKKVKIICSEHGEFWQTPHNHLLGQGCPKCSLVKTTEDFIRKAQKLHGNIYDYSKSVYYNSTELITIICKKHGMFKQTPSNHLNKSHPCGCPLCKMSKLEEQIQNELKKNNIKYEYQKRFKWLGKQSLDFYLPDYNIAIECQGIQHFEPCEYFGGTEGFKKQIKRDKIKKELCSVNNIRLLFYCTKIIFNEDYYNDITKLIETIIEKSYIC